MKQYTVSQKNSQNRLHNSIVLAIFVPKIIKVGEYLTKFWQKQFWLFFWRHGVVLKHMSTTEAQDAVT